MSLDTDPNSPPDVPRPDPSILISARPLADQQRAFALIVLALSVGTATAISLLTLLEHALPGNYFALWRDYTWPAFLSLSFMAAGVAHFRSADMFAAIVPPRGTWGFWAVPAPGAEALKLSYAMYHTYWSGIAEFGGGLLLAGTAVAGGDVHVPALLMFALVAAVTPANIYMATHDAVMGGKVPRIPYPWGHVGRGVVQCLLLALFWKLAFQG